MKELKFKAWDKVRLEWLPLSSEVWLITHDGKVLINPDECDSRPEDIEIVQYTGMIDENGQDIYEGDIVNYYEFNEETQEVINMGVGVVYFDDNYECNYTIKGEEPNSLGRYMLKVVGNIYENDENIRWVEELR